MFVWETLVVSSRRGIAIFGAVIALLLTAPTAPTAIASARLLALVPGSGNTRTAPDLENPANGLTPPDGGSQRVAADPNCCPNNMLVCPLGRHFCAPGRTPPSPAAGRAPPPAGQPYNPAWQAAPGDSSCCPNNMLVCPLGRHFCGH